MPVQMDGAEPVEHLRDIFPIDNLLFFVFQKKMNIYSDYDGPDEGIYFVGEYEM